MFGFKKFLYWPSHTREILYRGYHRHTQSNDDHSVSTGSSAILPPKLKKSRDNLVLFGERWDLFTVLACLKCKILPHPYYHILIVSFYPNCILAARFCPFRFRSVSNWACYPLTSAARWKTPAITVNINLYETRGRRLSFNFLCRSQLQIEVTF